MEVWTSVESKWDGIGRGMQVDSFDLRIRDAQVTG
jgi:hypothetical protein